MIRDLFESIHDQVVSVSQMEQAVESMRMRIGSHAQSFGPISKGEVTDNSSTIITIVELENELDVARARLIPLIDHATSILYGSTGRGGLAKARSYADADCICGYYLMGLTWAQVAAEMAADSLDAEQWCKRRAYRALMWLECADVDKLIET